MEGWYAGNLLQWEVSRTMAGDAPAAKSKLAMISMLTKFVMPVPT